MDRAGHNAGRLGPPCSCAPSALSNPSYPFPPQHLTFFHFFHFLSFFTTLLHLSLPAFSHNKSTEKESEVIYDAKLILSSGEEKKIEGSCRGK